MRDQDREILNEIREHCLVILEYQQLAEHMLINLETPGDKKRFSKMFQDGLLLRLRLIGEAADHLSKYFINDTSEVCYGASSAPLEI